MDFPPPGILTTLGDNEYYIPKEAYKLSNQDPLSLITSLITPVTVFHSAEQGFLDVKHLVETKTEDYCLWDDVFSSPFLSHIIIAAARTATFVGEDGSVILVSEASDSWGTLDAQATYFTSVSKKDLPPGPYFLINGALHQVWKCYDDSVGAFTTSIVPSPFKKDSFINSPNGRICVPSRLYYGDPTPEKPLSGLRLAIKDVIDIKGIKTGNCCRAYEQLYPSREKNAFCVQRLLDLGAVIIGKTKTVQFASGIHPMDWVDTQCPFNSRGDGYQDPGISSAGSAAAVAAYKWLDIAIGTDTIGSTITPASVCGLFGIRPTIDSLCMDGIIAVTKHLDTIGILTRSAALLTTATSALFNSTSVASPLKGEAKLLILEDLWPNKENLAYTEVINAFTQHFEIFASTSFETINLSNRWLESEQTPNVPLFEYLQTSTAYIQLYDCYNNSAPFRTEYKTKFSHEPFVETPITYKWNLGKELQKADYDKALRERETFRSWVRQTLLTNESFNFLLVPADGDEPNYRDQYFPSGEESGKSLQGFGFKVHCLPALLGCPAFCVPIGEYEYLSRISGREERLPICANLIGPPGSEAWACQFLVEFLKASGRPTSVSTGKHAFENWSQ